MSIARRVAFLLLLTVLLPGEAVADPPLAKQLRHQIDDLQDTLLGGPEGYIYTDKDGARFQVEKLEQVPERYRAHAEPIEPEEEQDAALFDGDIFELGAENDAPQVIYKYKKRDGREAYTNIIEQVPPKQRDGAAMDLSKISLNSQVGRELEAQMARRHQEMRKSDYCVEAREEASAGVIDVVWRDYAPLVVCGGLLLMFILFTPVALKRMSVPDWMRTLTMAVPTLALAGLLMFSMTKANRTISEFKKKAVPCEKQTWDSILKSDKPISQHAGLLRSLRDQMAVMDAAAGEYRGAKRRMD